MHYYHFLSTGTTVRDMPPSPAIVPQSADCHGSHRTTGLRDAHAHQLCGALFDNG
ncbi:hypothetical protein [Desulfosarcina alkanivorans]|uniref:hypothetical protein n=1 Tax=Desulfosarcina alkanivorans TaxID=571177 RepID=UPI0012D2CD45|nr:hypothetical protein [Desulfosarcina alkanivorans]